MEDKGYNRQISGFRVHNLQVPGFDEGGWPRLRGGVQKGGDPGRGLESSGSGLHLCRRQELVLPDESWWIRAEPPVFIITRI